MRNPVRPQVRPKISRRLRPLQPRGKNSPLLI
jgi:hypothetical protein